LVAADKYRRQHIGGYLKMHPHKISLPYPLIIPAPNSASFFAINSVVQLISSLDIAFHP